MPTHPTTRPTPHPTPQASSSSPPPSPPPSPRCSRLATLRDILLVLFWTDSPAGHRIRLGLQRRFA
ncbi:MAG: hypothetical protein ACYCSR_05490, partial [Thiomonas sp.]